MNTDFIREFALQLPGVTESFPFGEDTLVFKVNNKIFLLLALDADPIQFNVKANPEYAQELREEYPDQVLPGYHMNKKHWNTIIVARLKTAFIKKMIDDSYHLVAKIKK
ncbi:MAG: uncharacterized protein JWQ27_1878 [Ferruginibacter sp.]|nr:uncharacterized protein [Ferruginibacter sp.]